MKAVRAMICVVLLAALGVGCGGPANPLTSPSITPRTPPSSSGPPAASSAVSFPSMDSVPLAGRLFGRGTAGVVLAHQSDDEQTAWWDFAETLRRQGYSVLTFNYRGVCPGGLGGCSKGAPDVTSAWKDVMGAARFMRSRGTRWIALVGASMGGEASIIAASKLGRAVDALVSLSGSEGFVGPLDSAAAHRTVAKVTAPKLFVAGKYDTEFAADALDYFKHSSSPKKLRIFGTGDHGIGLLRYDQADAVTALVLGFLHSSR